VEYHLHTRREKSGLTLKIGGKFQFGLGTLSLHTTTSAFWFRIRIRVSMPNFWFSKGLISLMVCEKHTKIGKESEYNDG
jgi:hypothetical protein